MGSFKINGLDSLINDLSALAALPDSVAEDMLNAGADIIEAEQHKTAKSMGVYDTGVTEGSIKKTKVKKTATVKSIDIFPQGVNSDGNRNAEVAFINEFGKSGKHGKKGQPARPFIRTANEAAEERATEAEEKVYNDFLNGKNL